MTLESGMTVKKSVENEDTPTAIKEVFRQINYTYNQQIVGMQKV